MSRTEERIPIVLKKILSNKGILNKWLKESGADASKYNRRVLRNHSLDIYLYWCSAPDMRLGQTLFNMGLTPSLAYYIEEVDWLVDNKYLRRQDITFWETQGLLEQPLRDLEATMAREKPKIPKGKKLLTPVEAEGYASEYFEWGLKWSSIFKPKRVTISSMTTSHIEALLVGPRKVKTDNPYHLLFQEELAYRKKQI